MLKAVAELQISLTISGTEKQFLLKMVEKILAEETLAKLTSRLCRTKVRQVWTVCL